MWPKIGRDIFPQAIGWEKSQERGTRHKGVILNNGWLNFPDVQQNESSEKHLISFKENKGTWHLLHTHFSLWVMIHNQNICFHVCLHHWIMSFSRARTNTFCLCVLSPFTVSLAKQARNKCLLNGWMKSESISQEVNQLVRVLHAIIFWEGSRKSTRSSNSIVFCKCG